MTFWEGAHWLWTLGLTVWLLRRNGDIQSMKGTLEGMEKFMGRVAHHLRGKPEGAEKWKSEPTSF